MTFSFHFTHLLILKFIPYLQKLQNSLLGVAATIFVLCFSPKTTRIYFSDALRLSALFRVLYWRGNKMICCLFSYLDTASVCTDCFQRHSVFFSMQTLSCITSQRGRIKSVHVEYYCDSFGTQLFVKYCNFTVCWNHSSVCEQRLAFTYFIFWTSSLLPSRLLI